MTSEHEARSYLGLWRDLQLTNLSAEGNSWTLGISRNALRNYSDIHYSVVSVYLHLDFLICTCQVLHEQ